MSDLENFNDEFDGLEEDFGGMELPMNEGPVAPVILILDCSDSMERNPQKVLQDKGADLVDRTDVAEASSILSMLNEGVEGLLRGIYEDDLSLQRVAVSFLPFGTKPAEPTPFLNLENPNFIVPDLAPMGITSMGAAIEKALDAVEDYKVKLKEQGIQYFRPQIVLLTDGLPTDEEVLNRVISRIHEAEKAKKLIFYPIGVDGADMTTLNRITVRPGLMIKDLNFDAFFQWLSQSQAALSRSQPGESFRPPAIDDWAEL